MTSRDEIVDRLDPQARDSVRSEPITDAVSQRSPQPTRADLAEFRQTELRPNQISGPARPAGTAQEIINREIQQRSDPIRRERVNRLQVLGLAYQPEMSPTHARIVAERLFDWSDGDPLLQDAINEDFGKAVALSGSEWWQRSSPFTETLWDEASYMIRSVAGHLSAEERRQKLEARNQQAQVLGPDAEVARIAEMSPSERERYMLRRGAEDVVFDTLSAGSIAGGLASAFFQTQRQLTGELGETIAALDRQDSEPRQAIEARAAMETTPQMALGIIARAFSERDSVTLAAGTDAALVAFEQMSQEDRDQLIRDVEEMRTEDLIEQYRGELEAATPFKEVATAVVDEALDAMITWEGAVHTLGISVIDSMAGLAGLDIEGEGPLEVLGEDGWEAFQRSFAEVKEGGIAGFYGLDPESATGAWVNVAASIGFDPFTWGVASGRKAAQQTFRYMTSREGVDALLSSGRGTALVRDIATTDDALKLAPMLHGMSGSARRKLLNATDEAVVADIIRDEATNGVWLMNGPALAMKQESIMGALGDLASRLDDTVDWLPGNQKVADVLTEMLRRQNFDRAVDLGEAGFLDDVTELVVSRFPNDPDAARTALDDLYRIFDEYQSSAEALAAERVAAAQELRRESTDLLKSAPLNVRRVPQARKAINEARNELLDADRRATELFGELEEVSGRQVDDLFREPVEDGLRSADEIYAEVTELEARRSAAASKIELLEDQVERFGSQYDEIRDRRARLLRRAQKIRRATEEGARPRSRALLAEWVDNFMDDWGREIGVPETESGELMWSQVRSSGGMRGSNAARLEPFAGGTTRRAVAPVDIGAKNRAGVWSVFDDTGTNVEVAIEVEGRIIWLDEIADATSVRKFDEGYITLRDGTRIDTTPSRAETVIKAQSRAGSHAADRKLTLDELISEVRGGPKSTTSGDVVAELKAIAFGEEGSQLWLPASPYELALWKGAKDAGTLESLNRVLVGEVGDRVGRAVQVVNRIWAAGLLFNPLNAAKAHLEDVIKFRFAGGSAKDTLRALAPLGVLKGDTSSAAQFVRQTITGLSQRSSQWEMIENGKRGHFEAATRWLEGTVLTDDATRAYARSVVEDDPTIWFDWWDEVGQFQRRSTSVPIPGTNGKVADVTGAQARQIMETMVETLSKSSKDYAEFKRLLLEVAGSGQRNVPKKLARLAPAVPTDTRSAGTGMNAGFDMLYGAPARGRGGVFHEHYFDNAMAMYEKRFEGRIIEDRLDELVEAGLAASKPEAEMMVLMRHPQLDEYLRNQGYVTRAFLERQASKWAGKHAQSLMYLGGSASRAGQSLAKVAPFAPAQFDFLRWWSRQMFANTELALNAPSSAVVGALGRVLGDNVAGNALSKVAQGSARVPIPFNFRLASRWAQLSAQANREGEDASAFTPSSLIETFTFLPIDLSPDNFLVEFTPGLGPIPTWAIHYFTEEGSETREDWESIFPTLDWISGDAEVDLTSIAKYLIPTTTRSLTGQVGWGMRGLAGIDVPGLSTWAQQQMADGIASPIFDWNRKPIGYYDTLKQRFGDTIAANPDLIADSATTEEMLQGLVTQVEGEMNAEEAYDRLRSYLGIRTKYGADSAHITHYEGLINQLPSLANAGIVGEAQLDQLTNWWGHIQAGSATSEVRRLFADQAARLLFDLPDIEQDRIVALNPGIAVNMVSSVQCAVDDSGYPVGPADYCTADGRIDQSHPDLWGEQGADVRRRGFEAGWFEPRPEREMLTDVIHVYNQARRNHARLIYESVTGMEYARRLSKNPTDTGNIGVNAVVLLNDKAVRELEALGIPASSEPIRAEDFRNLFSQAFESWPQRDIRASDNPFYLELKQDSAYSQLLANVDAIEEAMDNADITSIYDWPDNIKKHAREMFAEAIKTDPELTRNYNRFLRSALGTLDYEPPEPPEVTELENAYRVDPNRVVVEDGDTIRVVTDDGDMRVRIIGINAPEQGQQGYTEMWDQLTNVIENADEVVIGQYQPKLFGTVQQTDADAFRLFAWLYVDGVPLYDPSVFTATNPRGADVGGNPIDLAERLREERQARSATEAPAEVTEQ